MAGGLCVEWLNYHHLLYFWLAAREGSITRASEQLHLAQQTVGGQIKLLEDAFGQPLFAREAGRKLVLTEAGRLVFRYADEIFALGRELGEVVRGRPAGGPLPLSVGVTDVVPKTVVHRLLEPALTNFSQLHLVAREDRSFEGFLAELAAHTIDLVVSDTPAAGLGVRVYNHVLGSSATSFMAGEALAAAPFPDCLTARPFILPGKRSGAQQALRRWFEMVGVRPNVVIEADDTALAQLLGEKGLGVFTVPSVVETETLRRYDVRLLGRRDDVQQVFYAISAERKLKHPAVVAICEAATRELFG